MSGALSLQVSLAGGIHVSQSFGYPTNGASGTVTIPTGSQLLSYEVFGCGGDNGGAPGGGGGGGGYAKGTIPITSADWGHTLSYTAIGAHPAGAASTISSGTKTISTITANCGGTGSGGGGGGGGTASGGSITNATGGAGGNGASGAGGTNGIGEASGRGVGALGTGNSGTLGGAGQVNFVWT